jgi:DNA repair exonuclease SbcCD ATPase subunit
MKIKLKSLSLLNFKGIQELTINLTGNMRIFGDNATGKTTIVDGFTWLLFDKDSLGNASFEIKTLTPDGQPIHFLDHKVAATLAVDNKEIYLEKIYREKWTKKRGSNEQEFSGHVTDYAVNGVPKTQAEYKKIINELINEDLFKMITNVFYFSNLHWTKRREIILKLCADVSDAEVLAQNKDLYPLEKELAKRSISDIIDVAKASKAKINKELESIPISIRTLKETDFRAIEGVDIEQVKTDLFTMNDEKNKLIASKSQNDNTSAILKLQNEIQSLKNEQLKLQAAPSKKQEEIENLRFQIRYLDADAYKDRMMIETKGNDLGSQDKVISQANNAIFDLQIQKENLYDEYDTEDAKEISAYNCQYCGQPLPADKLDEIQDKFNLHKAETLKAIVTKGQNINKRIDDLKDTIARAEDKKKTLSGELETLKIKVKSYDEKKAGMNARISELESTPEVNPNQARINEIKLFVDELESRINKLRTSNSTSEYDIQISELDQKIKEANNFIALSNLKKDTDKRIAMLIEQEKVKQDAYQEQDALHRLAELFVVEKAKLLEGKINDNFEMVNFKLFDRQVNGGINDCCDITVEGVPYGSLNHAMQINAGLDIIHSLQKIYDVTAPIFIDNAESVTKIKSLDTQAIKLYVSANDKSLRIEEEK